MWKLAFALLFLAATAAHAGVRNCNVTLTTANVCNDPTDQLFYVSMVPATATRLVDAIAVVEKYQETVNGQPNPETRAQFADRMLKLRMKAYLQLALEAAGRAAAEAAMAADPIPVIP